MQSYQHLSPQVFRYAKLCNLLANGYYDKVLQELHDINHDHDTSWIMMKLIALDGLNQSKVLCETLHQYQHMNWSYRQKLMINFLKAKHQYDKKRLLLYLRTVILGEGFLTDDVIILKYLQHQAHALFRKYFYYKEATEVYIRFQQKIERLKKSNQLLIKEPIGSFVYV